MEKDNIMSDNVAPKKHVLIISSSPPFLVEIKVELMPFFNVSIAATHGAARATLDFHDVSAVILCISNSCEDAFSVFNSISDIIESRNTPVIILAEKGNDDDEVTAFAMGAVDYTTRRRGTTNAMVKRIRLRIDANEHEKSKLAAMSKVKPGDVSPEIVLAGKTILVVDDVPINREIVIQMLADVEDLTIDTACDGAEAVDSFNNNPDKYSLILMDIHMPNKNGYEATKEIRAMSTELSRSIPIVALTADTQEGEIEKCFESGMTDYIDKPMSREKLFAMVIEHCL